MPKDAHLHDLASLSAIDSKDINAKELGVDVIKAQQAANFKYSSNQCAIIPEDRAQIMLAGVNDFQHLDVRLISTYEYRTPHNFSFS